MERYIGIDCAAPGTTDKGVIHIIPDTVDRSGLLEEIENRKNILRKNHHGKDCIICFEMECICKPKS